MSKKRSATTELNSDNWDVEDEPEEPGTFKNVAPEILQQRVIKIAKRKLTRNNNEGSKLFSKFTGFGMTNNSTDAKSTFSFLANVNGAPSEPASSPASTTSVTSPAPVKDSSPTISKDRYPADESTTPKESVYLTKVKVLNECLVEWISKWVSKSPTCVLTPVFRDYEKHLTTIKEEVEKNESKQKEVTPTFKFNFTPNFNNNQAQNTTLSSSPKKDNTPADSSKQSETGSSTNSGWPKTGFTFGEQNSLKPFADKPSLFNFSSKPPFLQNVAAPEKTEDNGDGEDEPPKVEFKPVTEDDAVYSQRVKVFIKNNDNYSDRGVGTLFIKEVKNDKGDNIYQAIVRADTSLGNILLNLRISKGTIMKRVGKNNVMLVYVTEKKITETVLLRVKTEEDADKLLAEINKYQ